MSRDAAIESWLASMSKSELIDQCFLWHDMALVHGRMYNVIKNKNAKLQELSSIVLKCIIAEKNKNKFIICWECPMHKQFDELRSYCCLEHEAKKLGIEVDE